jgi:hypothetical protein
LHDQSSMRYPVGISPFKSPLEKVELDKPWVRSMVSEVEFRVVLRQGISRRDAMALIHHASAVTFSWNQLWSCKRSVSKFTAVGDTRCILQRMQGICANDP